MKVYIGLIVALIVTALSQAVMADPEMVLVKGGCFQMGDIIGNGDDDEKPVHEVCLDDFYIGKYEVTQREWMEVMGKNPSAHQGCDDCPVENVSWKEIKKFIKKLNKKTKKNYRFPTEAEWEYAARSGGKDEQWAGLSDEVIIDGYAWFEENSHAETQPVGKKTPNGLGIYDMSGNVDEFVWDIYDKWYYKDSPKHNPKGPKHKHKYDRPLVYRGGTCISGRWPLRTASRNAYRQNTKSPFCGFRLASSSQ